MTSYYLPEKVIPFVKCFYVGKLALGSVDIVVCMDNGYVVEYAGFKIKRKCETRCYNADSIVPFSAYEPNRNFYVIKAPNSIVVVLREDKLKVLETYSTVQKYCIRDFSGKGFPMVGIWTKSSQAPDIITNFVEKTEIPERENTIALSGFLFDKLQEIRKMTRESELKLAERQELRERCTRNLEETIMKKLHSEMQEGATSDQKLSQLYVVKHWHRIHNNKWVLGTTVTNSSSRNVSAINMLLSCDDEPNLCYCTRVVQFQKATRWTSIESLLANTTAHILTILEVPCFKNTMVEISATITCKVESDSAKELQLHVPPFQLKVQDAVNNWNTTFTSHEDPEDVLSVLAASEKVTLTARWQRPELQLEKILAMNMHFVDYVQLGCFYNSGKETPGLAGLMVEIAHRAGSDFIISVYSRNTQQLYLFVSMFYDAVPLDTVAFLLADDRRVDCDRLREAFREELVLVRGLLPDDAMACDSDDVVVGCEKYASFREHFSRLELTTDMLASGNHQPIA